MTPALKLNLFVGFPSYGGNGGISSEVPDIREWWSELVLKLRDDPRIGKVFTKTVADTPITAVRNDFVQMAKECDCHLLMMVDSDQGLQKHAGESWYKPFWDEAFNFIYDNYGKGPRMVFAPYVGSQENVFVFKWSDGSSTKYNDESFELKPYDRQEAAMMSGIHEAAAGPTGLILIDMRCCDLVAPSGMRKRDVLEKLQTGEMTVDEADWALHEGHFFYEWETTFANKKASTEDVTFTRNVSLAGIEKLGYNPVFCAWDSWIGHHKPINVGRPQRFSADHVHASLRKAVVENSRPNEVILDLSQQFDQSQFANAPRFQVPVEKQNGTVDGYVDFVKKAAEKAYAASNGHKSNGHAPKFEKYHWSPLSSAMAKVRDALPTHPGAVIVDIGPGDVPMPRATHFVGKSSPKVNYPGTFIDLNLDYDRLPFDDGSVDFVYCRHTIEDLQNPEHALSEIRRVAKAGYIETPSPMCEATKGVNAPGSNVDGRGYPHHRSVVWSAGGQLKVLPKMPAWEHLDLPDYADNLKTPEMWNAYHFWKCNLNYIVLANDRDYLLGVDDRYLSHALNAVDESRGETTALFSEATDITTPTGRETTGPWYAHGHAPKEQCDALADMVRSEGYRKQPQQDELRILEVGSWLGTTAMAMADATSMARVFCVDTWEGSPSDLTSKMAQAAIEEEGEGAVFNRFKANVGHRLDKSIFPFPGTSAENAKKHWEQFDIIFIDAEHTYEALKAQILEWWPHLKDDGVMCGHDFMVHGYDGVGIAIHELFGEKHKAFGFAPQGCMWRVDKEDHLENENVCQVALEA